MKSCAATGFRAWSSWVIVRSKSSSSPDARGMTKRARERAVRIAEIRSACMAASNRESFVYIRGAREGQRHRTTKREAEIRHILGPARKSVAGASVCRGVRYWPPLPHASRIRSEELHVQGDCWRSCRIALRDGGTSPDGKACLAGCRGRVSQVRGRSFQPERSRRFAALSHRLEHEDEGWLDVAA